VLWWREGQTCEIGGGVIANDQTRLCISARQLWRARVEARACEMQMRDRSYSGSRASFHRRPGLKTVVRSGLLPGQVLQFC